MSGTDRVQTKLGSTLAFASPGVFSELKKLTPVAVVTSASALVARNKLWKKIERPQLPPIPDGYLRSDLSHVFDTGDRVLSTSEGTQFGKVAGDSFPHFLSNRETQIDNLKSGIERSRQQATEGLRLLNDHDHIQDYLRNKQFTVGTTEEHFKPFPANASGQQGGMHDFYHNKGERYLERYVIDRVTEDGRIKAVRPLYSPGDNGFTYQHTDYLLPNGRGTSYSSGGLGHEVSWSELINRDARTRKAYAVDFRRADARHRAPNRFGNWPPVNENLKSHIRMNGKTLLPCEDLPMKPS
jgi:hypothetical protein